MLANFRDLGEVWRLARTRWSDSVDYPSRVGYFARHSLKASTRLLIGGFCALLASVSVVIQLPPTEPATAAGHVVDMVFTGSAVLWTLAWWFGPWPSHFWSVVFILYADTGITAVTCRDSSPLAGMFGLNLFVLVSVYAIFFDSLKIVLLHTLWVLTAIFTFATDLTTAPDHDIYPAATKTIVSVAVLVVTPLAIQVGIWVLRNDANNSVTDELTGLLNRRGLYMLMGDLLSQRDRCDRILMVTVIDLDQFKDINDTYGHAVGDAVLIRSANRIKSAARDSALVARIGGEEFVVVDMATSVSVTDVANRIKATIVQHDDAPVTASMGVATVGLLSTSRIDGVALVDVLIAAADIAMFRAKRLGGNTIHHVHRDVIDTGNDLSGEGP